MKPRNRTITYFGLAAIGATFLFGECRAPRERLEQNLEIRIKQSNPMMDSLHEKARSITDAYYKTNPPGTYDPNAWMQYAEDLNQVLEEMKEAQKLKLNY